MCLFLLLTVDGTPLGSRGDGFSARRHTFYPVSLCKLPGKQNCTSFCINVERLFKKTGNDFMGLTGTSFDAPKGPQYQLTDSLVDQDLCIPPMFAEKTLVHFLALLLNVLFQLTSCNCGSKRRNAD